MEGKITLSPPRSPRHEKAFFAPPAHQRGGTTSSVVPAKRQNCFHKPQIVPTARDSFPQNRIFSPHNHKIFPRKTQKMLPRKPRVASTKTDCHKSSNRFHHEPQQNHFSQSRKRFWQTAATPSTFPKNRKISIRHLNLGPFPQNNANCFSTTRIIFKSRKPFLPTAHRFHNPRTVSTKTANRVHKSRKSCPQRP